MRKVVRCCKQVTSADQMNSESHSLMNGYQLTKTTFIDVLNRRLRFAQINMYRSCARSTNVVIDKTKIQMEFFLV